jgi:Pretoxin HINT domain
LLHYQSIRTTAEHPFYQYGKGWVAANELEPGDRLLTETGTWAKVDKLDLSDEHVPIYNIRVSDYHTYFVGGEDWGFAVWAHNSYYNPSLRVSPPETVAAVRSAFNSSVRTSFIKNWAATSAQAKRLLSSAELLIASKRGLLPEGFVVHHMVPIYRGGTNVFSNLRVMRQSFHKKFSEALHNYPVGRNPYGR